MLKTNWSHVVAQPPPPGQSSREISPFPRQWRIPQSKRPGRRRLAVNLTFILGEGRWPESQSNSNGWQLFIRDDLFHPSERMIEHSWMFARVPRFTDALLFWISNILKSSGCAMGIGEGFATHPAALPSIRECLGRFLEIQTCIFSVGYGLNSLKLTTLTTKTWLKFNLALQATELIAALDFPVRASRMICTSLTLQLSGYTSPESKGWLCICTNM